MFSAISDSAAASSRRSISIATERDMVLMTSTSRSRRASAEYASALCATKKKSERSRRKREATLGRSTLTATGMSHAVAFDLAAMHLRDRGGRDRRPEAGKSLRDRAFQRGRDRRFGLGLRKRRQPVLQRFEIARHHDADHVGPRREELAELEIGRTHPFQRARQPRSRFGAAPLDEPRQLQRELCRAAAPARDRRRRTRLRARTRNRRGQAARCG